MNFKKFLEQKDPHLFSKSEREQDNVVQIVKTIQIECADMLEAYQMANKVLLRGIKEADDSGADAPVFGSAKIRQDRRPIFMDRDSHDLINKAMNELKLPTRGNSLFVTTKAHVASDWGSTHIVFIKDGWTGLTFDKVDNDDYAYDYLSDHAYDIRRSANHWIDYDADEEMKKVILGLGPNKFSTPHALSDVLEREVKDILIQGDSYYGLSLRHTNMLTTLQVLEMLSLDPKNLAQTMRRARRWRDE